MNAKNFIAANLLLFSSLTVASAEPQAFRDWFFDRQTLPDMGDTCMAYTDKKVGEINWRLSILYQPGRELPATISITTADPTVTNSVIYSQTDSSSNIQKHLRSDFLDNDLGNKAYWFAPVEFVDFYKYIRRGSALKVKYMQEREKQLLFSLMGSTAATNKISELCNNRKEFVPEAFYNYVDKLNITQIPTSTDASVANAWDDLGDAWDFYLESSEHQVALADLQKQIDPLVAKEKEYLKQQGLLTKEIESQEKAKADLEALVVTQKAQLATAQQNLAAEDVKLQAALVVLKEKEDIFRPVKEEGRPYFAAVDSAKQRVSSLNTQIANTNEQIRQLKAKINSLWSEVATLENKIRQQQSELSSLRAERIRANNEYLSFNVERELRQRLSADWFYQQKLREKQQSDDELIRKKDRVSDLELEVRDLERQLRQCQTVPTNDCSSIQNELNQARNDLQQAKNAYNSELAENRQLEQQIAARESEIRRVVEDEKQKLADRVRDLDISINNVETAIDQNEFKLSNLRNSDIPRAERELSSAENTLVTLQGQLETAKESLRRAEQDLATFKARTDYDRKEREYLAADRTVQEIRARMTALDTQIKALQVAIAKNEAKIVSIAANIEKLITQLASTNSGLAAIQAQLAPLLQQKEALTAQLLASQAKLKASAEQFRVNLRDLPTQKSRMPSFPQKFHDWL